MSEPDVRAVEQLFERFMAAFNAGDLETLRSSYTDDALVIPPGQPSAYGPDGIIDQLWGPTFQAFDVDATLPIEEIQLSDDYGFVRGTYRMRLEPINGGDSVAEEGRWIDIVRKDSSGTWKIARAIWNAA